jgi:hypothetical protein
MKQTHRTLLTLLAVGLGLIRTAIDAAEQETRGTSPSGEIQYELREGADDSKRIWLFPKDRPASAVELCETPGWGNLSVHFSPDDNWLIVQDGGGSLGVSLRLFKRDAGVRFRELEEAKIDDKIERLALAQAGAPAKEVLDHRYARVLAWSADSKAVLVSVSGSSSRDGRRVSIADWTATYELGSGAVGLDLKKFNRAAATTRRE